MEPTYDYSNVFPSPAPARRRGLLSWVMAHSFGAVRNPKQALGIVVLMMLIGMYLMRTSYVSLHPKMKQATPDMDGAPPPSQRTQTPTPAVVPAPATTPAPIAIAPRVVISKPVALETNPIPEIDKQALLNEQSKNQSHEKGFPALSASPPPPINERELLRNLHIIGTISDDQGTMEVLADDHGVVVLYRNGWIIDDRHHRIRQVVPNP